MPQQTVDLGLHLSCYPHHLPQPQEPPLAEANTVPRQKLAALFPMFWHLESF